MLNKQAHQEIYQNYTFEMLIEEIYNLKQKIKQLKFKECKNCKELFTFKNDNKIFCNDECRMEHWEKENGKTLRFFPKK